MTTLTNATIDTVVRRVRRAAQLYRMRGMGPVCYAIFRRAANLPMVRRCWHLCAVEFLRLPIASDEPAATTRLYTVRQANDADRAQLVDYFNEHDHVPHRLAHGHSCYIAANRQAIGAGVWLAFGRTDYSEDWHELRSVIQVPAGVAWSYDGKGTKLGAWGVLMRQLPALLHSRNVSEIATVIDCDNWQSLDAHRSLGYQAAGVLLHIKFLGLPLRLFKPPQQRWQRVPKTIGRIGVEQWR